MPMDMQSPFQYHRFSSDLYLCMALFDAGDFDLIDDDLVGADAALRHAVETVGELCGYVDCGFAAYAKHHDAFAETGIKARWHD